ncbi:MAG: hypothetical protein FJZ01_26710, partial [Candidatus Sericytochromatia bacterium]|nr:hypothetical protein [Candidatus Tanganyikabacteria bacterium]
GTSAGVHDLNGNVWEWTGAVGAAITTGNYLLHDINTASSVGDGFISALSTDPRLRRFGLPGASAGATALLGGDRLWKNTANAAKALRGGGWTTNCVCGGTANGVWAISLYHPRTLANAGIGFRPALRY